jgi:hypothetical protein
MIEGAAEWPAPLVQKYLVGSVKAYHSPRIGC